MLISCSRYVRHLSWNNVSYALVFKGLSIKRMIVMFVDLFDCGRVAILRNTLYLYVTHHSFVVLVATWIRGSKDGGASLAIVDRLAPLRRAGDRNGVDVVDEAVQGAVVVVLLPVAAGEHVDHPLAFAALSAEQTTDYHWSNRTIRFYYCEQNYLCRDIIRHRYRLLSELFV